ncbi:hypothetical protein TTHERM_00431190 (macronuclear) [Tetrahymena thermophila SB210]|uniref:Uncharacterized protein n=1 Tax=Tetrahymena thermophila (strain SB210) TaxID=312017 RepID=Q231E0_TETTS|nr:hypothetical protein TTHERM_00431190 [Tetrahymena thermophila SB210]EAR91099.1 hypothetical protein TTHERM_00431190 [Tetrahymena thermophila SB210]|eukprot:XP_001011344.1 hypothetical protein TTHERM_00431190 [Tetrahymena thermophila SB210]
MCDTNMMNRDPSQSCASSSTIYPSFNQESYYWNESYCELNFDDKQDKYQPNQQQYYTQQTQLCLQQDYQEDTWNVDELFNFNNTPKNNQIQTTQQQFSNNYEQMSNTEVFYNNNYFDASRNQQIYNNKIQQQNHINNQITLNNNNQHQIYSYSQNGTIVYKVNQPESIKFEDDLSSENSMINYNINQNQNQQIKQSCQFKDQQLKNQLFNQQNQINNQNYQFYTQQPNNQQFNQYNSNIINNQQCFQKNQQNYQQTNSLYSQQLQSPIQSQNLYQNPHNPQSVSQQQQLDNYHQEKIINNAQTSQNFQFNQLSKHSQSNLGKLNIPNNNNNSISQQSHAGYQQQGTQKAQQDNLNTPTTISSSHQIRELQQESKEIYQILNLQNKILLTNKDISESTDSKSCSGTIIENTKESSETKSNLTQDSQVRQNIYKSIMNAFKIFLSQKQKICELFVNQEQLKIDNKLKQLARFLKTHSFNHQVLKYIALHDTYSIIFSHFINKECEMWLQKSKIVKKDIAVSILNYLKQCVIDKANFDDFVCYKTSKKSKKQKEYNFEDE